MNKNFISPVAYIRTDFKEKFGIPRQSGRVQSLIASIVFEPEYRNPDAIRGIDGFSHLWLIFDFSKAHKKGFTPTVRPPRLGGNQKVGVFASRSPFRPNSLGLSSVKLVGVEQTENLGTVLKVSGADLLDGTPIYDIKPYLPFTDCHIDAVGGYADEHTSHRLEVIVKEGAIDLLPEEKAQALIDCLAEDPRPSYHDDEREYGMKFSDYNIRFSVKENTLTILETEKV